MILIINCLLEEKSILKFNEALKYNLGDLHIDYEIIRAVSMDEISDLNKYTHLIISGSAASAKEDRPWNYNLENAIIHFINNKKPILGICYGHQFLVRVLAGVEHVRVAERGEIGFARIDIDDNELFEGIENPVFCVSHYEEVFDLNDDFNIIARNKNCSVHGFQYNNLPIWGTQFHPEYRVEDMMESIKKKQKEDPDFKKYYINELKDEREMLQNKLIFKNFVNSNNICLRPHHLMCIQSYVGKGYSEKFIENMDTVVENLKENPNQIIRIVKGNDHICNYCPHNLHGVKCESDDKVNIMDKKVLEYLNIAPGKYSYSELLNRLKEIRNEEVFKNICRDCEWYTLCY
ncbi:GMP synthase-like glutamine amidotransferase [Keratinibaculum paraultunense]|uniref:GMP synthase-like glutamine amidotransferase n=1 Tax=Keratinibaculum paraultunense TaxID=1278232 RepID=A0A4R3KZX6_9FIRM|nr:DUF1284 domain-containing protein [Keratinibaculum paraultunense]QQY79948.1 DUF1284 domain-containing protein [Keratinibaculum paraultunense]TCS91732.1 GMP synthase-like glutamine amidotransferase [Keratinibaculum paraultunense]